jgi:UDPglucose--hexose-1-phosphate uridylyltransferase
VPGRAGRPGALGRTTRVADAAECPFCAGHEALTPPEVAAFGRAAGDPDTPGWTVRVVPNKYPAFPGHEVVVHGPDHRTSLTQLPSAVLETVAHAWRDRRAAHAGSGYTLIAVNEGAAAGASLDHTHSQIVPFPSTPPVVVREATAFAPGCPLCPLPGRHVAEEDGLVTFCPEWSRMPYETWIAPVHHEPVAPVGPELTRALAGAVARLQAVFGAELAWNAVLHDAPVPGASFHWHLEIMPRVTVPASVELGAGIWVNVVDPDRAAAELSAAAM